MTLCIRLNMPLVILVCCTLPVCTMAQSQSGAEPPLEWGKISKSDFEMKSYLVDSTVSAVVLCDYGETSLTNDLGLVFTRHERIKIVSEAGYEWATHIIRYYAGDEIEYVRDIEGATYSLTPDGTIAVTHLDAKSVFELDYDQKYRGYRFTLPALQPGCIIEFRYKIIASHLYYIQDWKFQATIPVLWSEYRVRIPREIAYVAVSQGYEPLYINERTDATQPVMGVTASYLHNRIAVCNQYRWVVRNAPGLREEPFTTTLEDYYSRMSLQLSEYALDGEVKKFLKTWELVIHDLLKNEHFGKMIDITRSIRKVTDDLMSGLTTPESKMAAIYDYVRSTIVWSGVHRMFADQEPVDLLESRKGNNAEIAFLMISMLRHAGVEADPVILSTRNHGRIQVQYPILDQFNYVLTVARIGTELYYLDPTDPFRPIGLLPPKVLNVRGLVVKEGPVQWSDIATTKSYVHSSLARLTLDEQGEIRGTIETVDEDYGALSKRRDLEESKEVEFTKNLFESDRSGLQIDSVTITGKENALGPFQVRARISSVSYAQTAGDRIYINPAVVDRQYHNPFKLSKRKFPVDMSYAHSVTSCSTIEIPPGWEVKEVPPNRGISIGSEFAVYTRETTVKGRSVETSGKLLIPRSVFPPGMYDRLKNFYEQMVTWQSEPIVLQRQSLPMTKPKKK